MHTTAYTHRGGYKPRSKRQRQHPYTREAGVILDTPPEVQLDIYSDVIIMTKRNGRNGWQSYPIDRDDMINALAHMSRTSGILPENCLATGHGNGETYYIVYIPPMTTQIRIAAGGHERIQGVPTPPLIWAGKGTKYRLWALNTTEYPTEETTPLYNAPFPNINQNGVICWGNADPRPIAKPDTMISVLELFLHGSLFNTHMSNNKSQRKPSCVLTLYPELTGDEYPLEDLIPAQPRILKQVVNGEVWE
jgi:PRTRC genetic system protein B